ncbi:hypothetical protein [Polaromonas jejuensis]|uniref:Tyr recombinase domain-containing protein n=1 Tax=Polaromonas jejuensis TaxID=457502 RepID=A0ABW0QC54_9BURK|nr:hypothetical protein [Polaromonas jejuensis]
MDPGLHPTMFGQPSSVRGLCADERDALIISMRRVDGVWVIASRYRDDVWWILGATTNTSKSNTKLDFTAVPEPFKGVTKEMIYRFMRRGRDGHTRPGLSQLHKTLINAKFFLEHVRGLGITSLSGVTTLVCTSYVQACKELRTGLGPEKRRGGGAALTAGTLYRRLGAVEAIHELSQHTNDPMPQHPWPDSSADHLSGAGKARQGNRNKTPLMPNEVFTALFLRAWSIVQDAGRLLELRDEMDKVGEECKGFHKQYVPQRKNLVLEKLGWTGGLRKLKIDLNEIRTACYIVVASLSGCRNHELAFLRSNAYYSSEDDDGERYWWMRSKSTKTGEGDTEWLIPEAAVAALKVIDRWAAPYQAMLHEEIEKYRAVDPSDLRIAEAQEHVGAVFVGVDLKKRKLVRTFSVHPWNNSLKAFARACGLDWDLSSHQFRRKFANYAARSQFGDLRYLREHFKHWSQDMTLGYAMNESQEMSLYLDIEEELDEIKESVVAQWLNDAEPLAGGYGNNIVNWRSREENITLFKSRDHMIRSIAQSTAIRSNGHAWCTADDNACVGNDLDRTRCGDGCNNAVIGRRHAATYQGLYDQLKELENCEDIGEGGRERVRRDLDRCRSVLRSLGHDPVGAIE